MKKPKGKRKEAEEEILGAVYDIFGEDIFNGSNRDILGSFASKLSKHGEITLEKVIKTGVGWVYVSENGERYVDISTVKDFIEEIRRRYGEGIVRDIFEEIRSKRRAKLFNKLK